MTPLMFLRAATTALALTLTASAALAMDFTKHPSDSDKENAILGSGKIEAGDAFRLQTYLTKLPDRPITALYLDSSGGMVGESMEVGRIVYAAKIRTMVLGDKARCNSACTTIFMAGRDRETNKPYRVKGSANNLGFHNFRPNLEDKKFKAADMLQTQASAQRTIMRLATYLLEVDADLEIIGLSLRQAEILNISNQEALRFGIHILEAKTNELVRYEPYLQRVQGK
jgi:hypothetical protein